MKQEKRFFGKKAFRTKALVALVLLCTGAVGQTNIIADEAGRSGTKLVAPMQQGSFYLTGHVSDEEGDPLVGVSLVVVGTTRGVVTDIDGNYSLLVTPGEEVRFSYIGMTDMIVKVVAGKTQVNMQMNTTTTLLGDVVVTGYQTISRERATGSFAVINPEKIKDKLDTDILSRMEGMIAGMNKLGNSKEGSVVLRGVTSFSEGTSPLYVVDGMPLEGNISNINPSDVQNITVLKDAAATSIYGARAANGVIVITTKNGETGKARISYNSTVRITPRPDIGYLGLMNSSELIDLEIEGFNIYHTPYKDLLQNPRFHIAPTIELLYKHEAGELTDKQLADQLQVYRKLDNHKQIQDEFSRIGVLHQHNLSLSGGGHDYRYMASLNYTGTYGNQKYDKNEKIGFLFKNDLNLTKWASIHFGASGTFASTRTDTGASTYSWLIDNFPSYYMIRDVQGNPQPMPMGKSDYELERLRNIGLKDERYSPILNRDKERYELRDHYYRLFAGMSFKLMDGFNFDINYQVENTYAKENQSYDESSYTVSNMINNAAVYDKKEKILKLNVPDGGQLSTLEKRNFAYTLRPQLNFDQIFGKHMVNALAGAEQRLTREKNATTYYMGYDANSLGFKPFNPLVLTELQGTEALENFFSWRFTDKNRLGEREDRFVSFYANASYEFDNRYAATGSIRVDQSNLFGTNPKYQYRPLWSLGGSWRIANEAFMESQTWLDRLTLRLTYGIGGNVPKTVGPYMTLNNLDYNSWIKGFYTSIAYPANSRLRWEKTTTTNVGIDFSILNNRLSGSLDYYYKRTTDLLGERTIDPTLGLGSMVLNYGIMSNKGVEISLQSLNIDTKKFSWGTNLVFSYNKNKLIDFNGTIESVFEYTSRNVVAVGRPLNSMYSYRYAGLSPENGRPLMYNKAGEKVDDVGSIDDLVYSGTRTPKYNAALKNRFSIADFNISFLFVYYGGYVLRDAVAPYMLSAPRTNITRKALNHWRKPGDEAIPGIAPAMRREIDYLDQHRWYAMDSHVKRGDYIKLRSFSVGYNLPRNWLRKCKIESATVTCEINDLWWWSASGDLDPEAYRNVGFGWGFRTLPIPTTYTLGVSINF